MHFSNILRDSNITRKIDLRPSTNREDTVSGSKAVGELPFMLAISVYEALREAVGSVKGEGQLVAMTASATAENLLQALNRPQLASDRSRQRVDF